MTWKIPFTEEVADEKYVTKEIFRESNFALINNVNENTKKLFYRIHALEKTIEQLKIDNISNIQLFENHQEQLKLLFERIKDLK